ncbi:CLUMA_CG018256, isoform A [Clunio marinus]|uniref:CLUMA_CG018256, isoform A n=1 Tax=Clunio marinus TaxID=568069 RepID=A0A1J1IZK5_9DIPT|nr:CLUMA_CG018256, isoform A [Clunio marinus]
MKTLTIFLGLALIAAVYAGHASSYVSQHDSSVGGYSHGGHDGGHDDHKDYYHHPSYKFEYGVKDPHTKAPPSQWEHRDGDHVKGEYSLDEADGTKRLVKYHADGKSGFHAEVERIGHAHHPEHYKQESHHHY